MNEEKQHEKEKRIQSVVVCSTALDAGTRTCATGAACTAAGGAAGTCTGTAGTAGTST